MSNVAVRNIVGFICLMTLASAAAAGPRSIVPGHSIGKITLGETGDRVDKTLGPSSDGDGASGHFWEFWRKKGNSPHETDIYTERDEGGLHTYVKQIRITSPYFVTANGISTRSTLAEIRRAYQNARMTATYVPNPLGKVRVYDDVRRGIAFDIAPDGCCLGIFVHPRDSSVSQIYSPFDGMCTAIQITMPARRKTKA